MEVVAPLKEALEKVEACTRRSESNCPMYGELKSLAEKGFETASRGDLLKTIMCAEEYFVEQQSKCQAMVLVHEAYLYKSMRGL